MDRLGYMSEFCCVLVYWEEEVLQEVAGFATSHVPVRREVRCLASAPLSTLEITYGQMAPAQSGYPLRMPPESGGILDAPPKSGHHLPSCCLQGGYLLDLYWNLLESGDVRCKSNRIRTTIWSSSEGWQNGAR